MPRKLLVIGAGPDQVPAIEIARARGLEVYAIDANPKAPGFALTDGHALVSTNDAAGCIAYAQQIRPDGVLTLASETGVPTVAKTAETLGLPGIGSECAYFATNKNAMRRQFEQHGVPTTVSAKISTPEQAQAFAAAHPLPLVIKPSDCSGQRGTTKIEDAGQLLPALADALHFSTDGMAIVETFAEGPEINITAVINRGEITFLSFSERVTAAPPHFGIAIEHAAPLAISEAELDALREAAAASIRAIGLNDGIAYPQVILSPHGPRVLEIAARIPGGFMREVALALSGIDLIEVAILQALGDRFELHDLRGPAHPAVNVKFITELDTTAAGTTVTAIAGLDEARQQAGVSKVYMGLQAGQKIPPLNSSAARFGAVIASGSSRQEAQTRARQAASQIRFSYAAA